MTSYSLFELNEYIKRVIALNFSDTIWVNCEISQVKESRGNVYLDIIQQDDYTDAVIAQANAVIWYKSFLFLKKKLGDLLPSILQDGTKVLIRVKVEYHERYGMKLVIEDIDPSYTIGQMEMARQKILERLKKDGVLEDNQFKYLPDVLQRIAVISSPTAAGFADFETQLSNNEYGYYFSTTLFPAAMQGMNTEHEVCRALDLITNNIENFDCVAIIRGGGSKLDLSSFDNYNIGHKIATYPIPVITGIGHEIDNTVADVTSHTSLKTPTAVASFLIDRNLYFESEIIELVSLIGQYAKNTVENTRLRLQQLEQLLVLKPKENIHKEKLKIEQVKTLLTQGFYFNIQSIKKKLDYTKNLISLSDPQLNLKRGYAIVKKNGTVVSSKLNIQMEDELDLEFFDGNSRLIVKKIK